MKSNVKAVLSLIVMLACRANSSGLVMAPMLETSPDTIASGGESVDAGSNTTRPLSEPRPPPRQTCTREVECIPPLDRAPHYTFPTPYERCDPSPIGRNGRFSARETDDRRRQADAGTPQADVCCYVTFDTCDTSTIQRPRHFHRP